ncbi:HLH-domain-containing protein [Annulohypoxylon maeteangense]|uniref:HLH-domain-containing protein n=1 Tax=Annulohypoxylon maeteangense TaxID=1927788 RepID=UPI0020085DF5|nr:HLH-domain-containing protein [Annulohypoxylon maeteangense]KAI0888325.1 HLH-domain-containing protein [Annulohypoxylon maeteangense]
MDTGVMQDIDVYPAGNDKTFETFFDQSTDYSQQLSSISFWDELDRSAESSVVNSIPTSGSRQTPSTAADSPASTASQNISNPSHKHKLTGQELPKKRQCSDIRRSRFTEDPSTLDCSDYWLRFDSDNESDQIFAEGKPTRSPALAQPHPRSRIVGRPGNSFKVAYPPSSTADLVDDSALDHALSDEEDLFSMALADQLSKTDSAPIPSDIPPRERLYSTPLSWEQPQPGFRMDYVNVNPPFNDPERQRLLAIAMGTGQAPQPQIQTRQPAGMDFRFEINQSPTTMSDSKSNTPEPRNKPVMTRPQAPSRTNSIDATADKSKDKPRNSDRAAHNDIERKYRTNLKDKIAELRDAIPSLRAIPEDGDENDNPTASRTAPKVSKGTVLTKATEYIHQLERRNRSMAQKNEELARRLHAFEQLVGAAPAPNWAPQGYGASVFNPRAFS